MTEMIICGLSMEMEMAEEMGWVGKCRGCFYCEYMYNFGLVNCRKKGKIHEQEDCDDWVVDMR